MLSVPVAHHQWRVPQGSMMSGIDQHPPAADMQLHRPMYIDPRWQPGDFRYDIGQQVSPSHIPGGDTHLGGSQRHQLGLRKTVPTLLVQEAGSIMRAVKRIRHVAYRVEAGCDQRKAWLALCRRLDKRPDLYQASRTFPTRFSMAGRAVSAPGRAENCGQRRSPTGTANGVQPGRGQVDPAKNDLLSSRSGSCIVCQVRGSGASCPV